MECVKQDLQLVGGNAQTSLGEQSGIKNAMHALQLCFFEDLTKAISPMDAKNAFNSLNRDLALKKHQKALSFNFYGSRKLL